jgi:predicted RNA binding protein YcfA (HicA-like mRNA interferase family)
VIEFDAVKLRDLIRLIEAEGWILLDARGGHRQYQQTVRRRLITIAGGLDDELGAGTVDQILIHCSLKKE